jgi:PST family polysaccharide transporter
MTKTPQADLTAIARAELGVLKRKSVQGAFVNLGTRGATVGIQLVSNLILARLISPHDYGIVAMVVAITGFAGLFRDLGLSAAVVQKGTLTQAQVSTLFWINVATGLVLTGLLAAAAPLVGLMYGREEVVPLTRVLALTFVIGSLGTQHGAMLQREMRFGRKAVASIAGLVVILAVSVVLALRGHGYWALAWGTLAGNAVTTALLFVLSPFRPGWPSRHAGIRSMMKFGANVTAFDFVDYFHRNLDNILIGRYWGTEALGLYSRAYSLMMFPIANLRQPINAVAFPAMSRLREQPQAFRAYFRKMTLVVAFLAMPVTAYLAVASRPVVRLALGDQWDPVTPIFAILAITGFIQPVAGLRGLVLLSSGQGSRYLTWGVLNAMTVCTGFCCGIAWGATGVAISYAISNYVLLYPSMLLAFRGTVLKPGDFFVPICRPAFSSIVAAAASWLSLQGPWFGGVITQVIGSGVIFAAVYLVVFHFSPGGKSDIAEIWDLRMHLRKNASPAKAA